jgi:hypothetical protein
MHFDGICFVVNHCRKLFLQTAALYTAYCPPVTHSILYLSAQNILRRVKEECPTYNKKRKVQLAWSHLA